jgi:hypothetical protein
MAASRALQVDVARRYPRHAESPHSLSTFCGAAGAYMVLALAASTDGSEEGVERCCGALQDLAARMGPATDSSEVLCTCSPMMMSHTHV